MLLQTEPAYCLLCRLKTLPLGSFVRDKCIQKPRQALGRFAKPISKKYIPKPCSPYIPKNSAYVHSQVFHNPSRPQSFLFRRVSMPSGLCLLRRRSSRLWLQKDCSKCFAADPARCRSKEHYQCGDSHQDRQKPLCCACCLWLPFYSLPTPPHG